MAFSLTLPNFCPFLLPSTSQPPSLKSPPSHFSLSSQKPKNSAVVFAQPGFHVQVLVDEKEHEERLVGRFKREVLRVGVLQEVKRRRFHENSQEKKKRKTREAARRNRRRRDEGRPFFNRDSPEESGEKKEGGDQEEEEDEDNWDLPGDIPN